VGETTRSRIKEPGVCGRPGNCRFLPNSYPLAQIIVKEVAIPSPGVGLYARVSSSDQRKDVEAQLGRLLVYAQSQRLPVVEAVAEIGCGLSGQRPKLKRLLANPTVQTIVVEHRDRLMRFGAEYVERLWRHRGGSSWW